VAAEVAQEYRIQHPAAVDLVLGFPGGGHVEWNVRILFVASFWSTWLQASPGDLTAAHR